MDKFAALRAFVGVVDEQGFSAAARALGLSRSAVNRMVIALEDELGAQLLNRTTRSVATTATGQAFYTRAKAILADLEDAERDVGAARSEVRGRLRISAPMSFGTLHLGNAISDFMAIYPELAVELNLNDRFVDIVEEGYDLVVRIGVPQEDTTLVDFRLCEMHRVICAAPDFLRSHPELQKPEQISALPCLHFGQNAQSARWTLQGPDGTVNVRFEPRLCSNNGEVLRDAAVRGLGIVELPTFIVGAELQTGRLVTVLPEYRAIPLMLSVIYPPSRHLSAKIRLFTDFLIERFGASPHWDLVQ